MRWQQKSSLLRSTALQPFAMNLSAPFIPQFFKSQVDEIMPYVDVLIQNESEAEAYAASHEWDVSVDFAFAERWKAKSPT